MEKNRKFYDYKGFLLGTQSLIVWFMMFAWWEVIFSFLSVKADKGCLYVGVLISTAVVNLILAGKKKKILFLVLGLSAGIFVWWNRLLFASALNHLVNQFFFNFYAGETSFTAFNESVKDGWLLSAAFVVLGIPMVLIFAAVLKYGRGKLAAAVLMAVPFVLAAAELTFPPVLQCAVFMMAAGIYFAVSGCSGGSMVFKNGLITAGAVFVMICAATLAGRGIEAVKAAHSETYLNTRAMAEATIAKQLRALTLEQMEEETTVNHTETQPVQMSETQPVNETQTGLESVRDSEAVQTEVQAQNGNTPGSSGFGDTADLKSLASFSPATGDLGTVTRSTRPGGTVYQAKSYGGSYDGNSWGNRRSTAEVLLGDSQPPDSTARLKRFCETNPVGSLSEAEKFIRSTFEETLTYSYNPGPTPENKDFAEYFLFDNQKGFCVHFATTAVLMYRLYGYPARFAEGYAVPASAFSEQTDGTWQAKITGTMGHAWCEVYEDGSWNVKEHTLSYSGSESGQVNPPAVSEEEGGAADNTGGTDSTDTERIYRTGGLVFVLLRYVCAAAFVAAAAAVIFFLQAKVRREKRKSTFYAKKGVGIQNIYRAFYDTAVFLKNVHTGSAVFLHKTPPADLLSHEVYEFIKETFVDVSEEDWAWMYRMLLESLFYDREIKREEQNIMRRIYLKTSKQAGAGLKGWNRIRYRYLECLG